MNIMETGEIIEAIQQLPLDEQRKIVEEVSRRIEAQKHAEKRQAVLALAGSWAQFPEEDTDDLLDEIKRNRQEMFNRKVDL
jgi:hypothetical protein